MTEKNLDLDSLQSLCDELMEYERNTVQHVVGCKLDLILSGGTYRARPNPPCGPDSPAPTPSTGCVAKIALDLGSCA